MSGEISYFYVWHGGTVIKNHSLECLGVLHPIIYTLLLREKNKSVPLLYFRIKKYFLTKENFWSVICDFQNIHFGIQQSLSIHFRKEISRI